LQLFGKEHESNKLHQKLQRNFDELPENLHEFLTAAVFLAAVWFLASAGRSL